MVQADAPDGINSVNIVGSARCVKETDANPEKDSEVARKDVLEGKVWSYPVLAGGKIYARSTKEGVCLDVN